MLSSSPLRFAAFAAASTLAVLAAIPVAPVGVAEPTESRDRYRPVESISYDLGPERMVGYFVGQAAVCRVMIRFVRKGEAASPMRLRLTLYPGQVAGLDSARGRSFNLTCGKDAATLLVETGARDRLAARQALALQQVAERRR